MATDPEPSRSAGAKPFPVALIITSVVFSLSVAFLVAWWVAIRPNESPAPIKVGDFVAGQPVGATSVTGRAEIGHRAPHASFPALDGSGALDLGALSSGKVTVVNFWASTCAPCVSEMPALEVSHRVHPEVSFVGVDVGDTAAAGGALAARTGVTYPQGFDPSSKVIAAFSGSLLPHTVVINAKGIVTGIHSGRLQGSDLDDLLASAAA